MERTSLHLTDDASISDLLDRVRRIAVLGIKPESAAGQPAHDVPRFLQARGFEIVPVPIYYPEATLILGAPVYRTAAAVPGITDLVLVFRRSSDVAAHVPDLLAARPSAVWLQLGIRDDAAAETLTAAGIAVVQDRCMKIELLAREPRG